MMLTFCSLSFFVKKMDANQIFGYLLVFAREKHGKIGLVCLYMCEEFNNLNQNIYVGKKFQMQKKKRHWR